MKILVLEDQVDQADSLRAVLAAMGHAAEHAPTALAAQLLAEAHPPEAVLLDLRLPAGGSLAFLDWLRGRPETARVPVVVGTAMPPERLGALEGRAGVAILTKPFTVDQLLSAFAKLTLGGSP